MKHFSLPKLDVIGRENLLSEKLLLCIIKHSVQQQGILHRHLYLLGVVDVNGGLEGKGLRVDGLLGTMVVDEMEVVRRTERQLLLQEAHLLIQLLVGLARLHLLLLGGKVANLSYELREPRLLGKLGVVIEKIRGNLTHVRIAIRVHGDETAAHLLAFIKRKIVFYHLNIILC